MFTLQKELFSKTEERLLAVVAVKSVKVRGLDPQSLPHTPPHRRQRTPRPPRHAHRRGAD